LIGNLTLPEKVYWATKLYRGKGGDLRKVKTFRGRCLKISSPRKVFIEADGELVGTTDAEFEMVPSALNILGWLPGS
jgi:diacylglycerol kinase family enzyme